MSIKDNIQYQKLVVRPGEYVPDVGVDYPQDDPYKRLLKSEHLRELTFDENYTYLDDSLSFKFQRFLGYFGVDTWMMLKQKIQFGIRFKGRDKIRRYKKEFKTGAITICNHCYRWDGVSTIQALRYMYFWIPMFADHFNGKDRWSLIHAGGIPIPTCASGLRKFNEAFDEIHRRGQWIHIFPEECNWLFYKPIKPFRKGAFTMAYKYNVPIIPLNISYRERKGIFKLFGKAEWPLITYNVGDPIFPDTSAPRKVEVERLLRESHKAMCDLAGIIENPWPAMLDEN